MEVTIVFLDIELADMPIFRLIQGFRAELWPFWRGLVSKPGIGIERRKSGMEIQPLDFHPTNFVSDGNPDAWISIRDHGWKSRRGLP